MTNFYKIKWLSEIRRKVRGYIPFSNWWILGRKINRSANSILDLGCGVGSPMLFINRDKQFYTVGIDGYSQSIEQCKKDKTHTVLLCTDIRKIPHKENTFDIVMCLQVLEHLNKQDGELLLKNMEKIAKKQVIISTDINEFVQGAYDGNELQVHKYIWNVDKLQEHGFTVYGLSLKGFGGDTGYTRKLYAFPRWVVAMIIQVIVGAFVYRHPKHAGAVVCIKNLEGE